MKRLTLAIVLALAVLPLASTSVVSSASEHPASSSAPSSFGDIPRDATALCVDNTWSSSKKRSGACSSHGGIKTWLGKPPKGTMARCKDGTYSKSTGQGTCSSHGGVAYPLKEPKSQG